MPKKKSSNRGRKSPSKPGQRGGKTKAQRRVDRSVVSSSLLFESEDVEVDTSYEEILGEDLLKDVPQSSLEAMASPQIKKEPIDNNFTFCPAVPQAIKVKEEPKDIDFQTTSNQESSGFLSCSLSSSEISSEPIPFISSSSPGSGYENPSPLNRPGSKKAEVQDPPRPVVSPDATEHPVPISSIKKEPEDTPIATFCNKPTDDIASLFRTRSDKTEPPSVSNSSAVKDARALKTERAPIPTNLAVSQQHLRQANASAASLVTEPTNVKSSDQEKVDLLDVPIAELSKSQSSAAVVKREPSDCVAITCSALDSVQKDIVLIDLTSDDDELTCRIEEPVAQTEKRASTNTDSVEQRSCRGEPTPPAEFKKPNLLLKAIKQEPPDFETTVSEASSQLLPLEENTSAEAKSKCEVSSKYSFTDSLSKLGSDWNTVGQIVCDDSNDIVPPCAEELGFYCTVMNTNRFRDEETICHAAFVRKEVKEQEKKIARLNSELVAPSCMADPFSRCKKMEFALKKLFNVSDVGDDDVDLDANMSLCEKEPNASEETVPSVENKVSEGVHESLRPLISLTNDELKSIIESVPIEEPPSQNAVNPVVSVPIHVSVSNPLYSDTNAEPADEFSPNLNFTQMKASASNLQGSESCKNRSEMTNCFSGVVDNSFSSSLLQGSKTGLAPDRRVLYESPQNPPLPHDTPAAIGNVLNPDILDTVSVDALRDILKSTSTKSSSVSLPEQVCPVPPINSVEPSRQTSESSRKSPEEKAADEKIKGRMSNSNTYNSGLGLGRKETETEGSLLGDANCDSDGNSIATVLYDDDDSRDTVLNSPTGSPPVHEADSSSDSKASSATKRPPSPHPEDCTNKKKSKYELILERKQQENREAKLKEQPPKATIADPRLTNLRERIRSKEKKTIPVINPLPLDTSSTDCKKTKGKSARQQNKEKFDERLPSPLEKVYQDDKNVSTFKKSSSGKITVRDPRLSKRPLRKTTDAENGRSESAGLARGNSERFQYRGSFLTENVDAPQKKKTRFGPPNRGRGAISGRNPTVDELHASADIPEIDNIVPAADQIDLGFQKRKIGFNEYKRRTTNLGIPVLPPQDPRLRDRPPVPGVGVASMQWNAQGSIQQCYPSAHSQSYPNVPGPAVHSGSNNYMFCGSNFMHYIPQSHAAPYAPVVGYPVASQETDHNSYQQPLLQHGSPTFIPPLPPGAPQPPPPPSPPAIDSPDSTSVSPSTRAEKNPTFSSILTHPGKVKSSAHGQVSSRKNSQPSTSNSGKAILLLPEPLKNAIGNQVVNENEILLIILSYSVSWLMEQKNIARDPPVYDTLKEISWSYRNYKDYFNTYISYLMLDNWEKITNGWKAARQDERCFCWFNIKSINEVGDMREMRCYTTKKNDRLPMFPSEGQLVLLRFRIKNADDVRLFGFVSRQIYTAIDGEHERVDLHIKMIYKIKDVDENQQVRILSVCGIEHLKKFVQALRAIGTSPLLGAILNPGSEPPSDDRRRGVKYSCRHVVQSRGRTIDQNASAVCKATDKIMSGIVDDDCPLLTVVDTPTGTDGLSTIISVIERMKKFHGEESCARILVCTKTAKRLEEIALRLISGGDTDDSVPINLIINCRAEATSKELQNFAIDRLIAEARNASSAVEGNVQDVDDQKTYGFVLESCDVILSLIDFCFDKKIYNAVGPKSRKPLNLCILDEAYMCSELESIVPLRYGIRKFVMFGDPNHPSWPESQFETINSSKFYRPLATRVKYSLTLPEN